MPYITAENAKELAARSNEAQRLKKERLAKPTAQPSLSQSDRYTIRRLMRTRRQIDSLSAMLEAETDPQKLDRLASALARLSEIERQLANRPLPGSWKPSAAPKQSRQHWPEPTPLPAPTPPVVVDQPKPEPGQQQAT